jgi:hypothetical protein
MREDFPAAAAMVAEEVACVLYGAEHRHIDLAEQVEILAAIEMHNVLRRRDDDRAGQPYLLRHRQLGITGAGRQVGGHDVELAFGLSSARRYPWNVPN